MTRWSIGEAEVLALLASDQLERVVADAATGRPLEDRARTTLTTARPISDRDPDSAYVLA